MFYQAKSGNFGRYTPACLPGPALPTQARAHIRAHRAAGAGVRGVRGVRRSSGAVVRAVRGCGCGGWGG
jgi:hypothetical protein